MDGSSGAAATTSRTRNRDIESLEVAASWPGAERDTLVVLAVRLAGAGADAEGFRFFQQLAEANPGQPLPLALAGFFQVRAGGDIETALAKLDQAAAADLGPPQYFRGLALAHERDPRRAEQAVTDLEFVLAVRDQFPPLLMRAVHQGLAAAYATLGKDDLAAEADRRSGLGSLPAGSRLEFGGFWATAEDGFRFTSPAISQPEPGIQVAQGYDFGDFAFISTAEGVVAIDAGTREERVRAALRDAGLDDGRPISHLILTHAHYDHVGGAGALIGPGTEVIAQAGFPADLERQRRITMPFRYLTGGGKSTGDGLVPRRLIGEPESVTVGGTEFRLYPAPGGETPDALMVFLPASGLLFTGDVLMPYLGIPFASEGSPDGLLDGMRFIRELKPRALIQGHTPLTDLFTIEALSGLEPALSELRDRVLDDIRGNRTLPEVLERNHLPEILRDHPRAVQPYVVIRDHFTARLYHERTGYWQPDGGGLANVSAGQRAAALDLLAEGREDRFASAATSLIEQGDAATALEIIASGLLRHPASTALAALRQTALYRLMALHQVADPFTFLIYADMAGAEIGPVG